MKMYEWQIPKREASTQWQFKLFEQICYMRGDLRLSIKMYSESRKYTIILLLLSLMKLTEQDLIKYRL